MKIHLLMRRIGLAVGALAMTACASSPNSQFYLLSAAPPSGPPRAAWVQVQTVHLSATTDRPQVVVRTGAQTVDVREYDRWAEPFDDMVTRLLRQDFEARSGGATSPARVVIVIDEFLPADDGTVSLAGHWSVPVSAPGTIAPLHGFAMSGRYSSGNLKDAAGVMSELLGRLADSIQAGLPSPAP